MKNSDTGGWFIWELWHTTNSHEPVPPDELFERVLAVDNTVEDTGSLQSLHSSLKFLFRLVKIMSSASMQWGSTSGMVLLKCHRGRSESWALRWLVGGFWAAAPSPWFSSNTVLVLNVVFEKQGWSQAQLLPCAGTVSHSTTGAPPARCPLHQPGRVPTQGWLWEAVKGASLLGSASAKLRSICWGALLNLSRLCWIEFQQRNLSGVFYLYPCSCQGDLNPSRNFCGKCIFLAVTLSLKEGL